MSIEEIQKICESFPGVTQDIKWENHLCFNVGGKMFLVTAPDQVPPSASIKVSDDDFIELPMREGIIPAPYMARHKWVFLDDIGRFNSKEWRHFITQAHMLVASKLPLKVQKSIGLITMAAAKKSSAKKAAAAKKSTKKKPVRKK